MTTEEKRLRDAERKRKEQPIEPETATDKLRREVHEQQMADYGQFAYGGQATR